MTTVQDPICGMAVTEHTAKAKLLYQGQTYYFCSALCKQLFERENRRNIFRISESTSIPDLKQKRFMSDHGADRNWLNDL